MKWLRASLAVGLVLCLHHSPLPVAADDATDWADPEDQINLEAKFTAEHGSRLITQIEFGSPREKDAAAALVRKCSPEFLPRLERLLTSDDRLTASVAYEAFRHLRWKPQYELRLLVHDLMDDFEASAESDYAAHDPDERVTIPNWPCTVNTSHRDPYPIEEGAPTPRWKVVHDLIQIGQERALPLLVRMINDPGCRDVTECAWSGINQFGGPSVIDEMLRHVDNIASWNRNHALFTLARLDLGLAFDRAIKGLRANPADFTCLAVLAEFTSLKVSARTEVELWRTDLTRVLDTLASGGEEVIQQYRAIIVRNIVLRGLLGSSALPQLEEIYRSTKHSLVRRYASLALARLQSPLPLGDMLNVREAVNDQVMFGLIEEQQIEAVILDYLRNQSDPRARAAVEEYERE